MCKWCVTASVQYLHYRPWNDLIIQIHSNHTRGVKQRRAKNHRAQRTFWISVCGYQPAAGCTVSVAEDSTNLSNDFIQTFQVLSGSFRPSSSQLRRIKSPLVQTLFFNYHKKNISSLLYSLLLTSFGFLPRTLKWSEQSRTETKSVSCNLPKFWRGDLGWSILRLESFCDQMQQRKKMKQGLKTSSRHCRLQYNDTKKKQTPVHSCFKFSVLSSETLRGKTEISFYTKRQQS